MVAKQAAKSVSAMIAKQAARIVRRMPVKQQGCRQQIEFQATSLSCNGRQASRQQGLQVKRLPSNKAGQYWYGISEHNKPSASHAPWHTHIHVHTSIHTCFYKKIYHPQTCVQLTNLVKTHTYIHIFQSFLARHVHAHAYTRKKLTNLVDKTWPVPVKISNAEPSMKMRSSRGSPSCMSSTPPAHSAEHSLHRALHTFCTLHSRLPHPKQLLLYNARTHIHWMKGSHSLPHLNYPLWGGSQYNSLTSRNSLLLL